MKQIGKVILVLGLLIGCGANEKRDQELKPVLLADREAPMGWVYLRIYENHYFEFEPRGLERKGNIYHGVVELNNDTLIFHYKDSIPVVGSRAAINKGYVSYFEGDYPESLKIKQNELMELKENDVP